MEEEDTEYRVSLHLFSQNPALYLVFMYTQSIDDFLPLLLYSQPAPFHLDTVTIFYPKIFTVIIVLDFKSPRPMNSSYLFTCPIVVYFRLLLL